MLLTRFALAAAFALFAGHFSPTFAGSGPARTQPNIRPASDEGEQAIRRFRVPEGFKIDLFAAEPMLANPVAFHIDHQGRFYVVESFRINAGVHDIRGNMSWLDDELANQTTDDMLEMLKRRLGDRFVNQTNFSEQVRLIQDTTGDGKADSAVVFADQFNSPVDGIAAGVLAWKGSVWFANIPNVWLLRDTTGDGRADSRRVLHYGYGVRMGFIGHDLHGLRMGPDGKIYFSIGDRAANVETEGRRVSTPEAGAVFRCNPDGSELELFAGGLRNPQELAFDQYGNLFTGDNNANGDAARLVYAVEGSDAGWRIGWQFIQEPNSRGAWHSEKMWHLQNPDQPAFLIPPVAHVNSGPSGITFYPGTGLPSEYDNHFFLCDFRGQASRSGIYTFAVKPAGAGFEMVQSREFIAGVLPTDVEFGPDGSVYVADWVEGWGMTGKGRLYRVTHTEAAADPLARETQTLLAAGMEQRSTGELAALLRHRDQRVRQEAQFELADRQATAALAAVLRGQEPQLARIHAIWGLGQIAAAQKRQQRASSPEAALQPVAELLRDPDPEVRAQAARVLGDNRFAPALRGLLALVQDRANPRGQFHAAMAAGKIGSPDAAGPVIAMLRENNGRDVYLRHAGVMALAGIGQDERIAQAASDASPEVRLAALLALRRAADPAVARFLPDADPKVATEAALAINDVPIEAAMPDLAALISNPPHASEPMLRRIVNANFRLGKPENASALLRFASRNEFPVAPRVEGLHLLAQWAEPSGRDRIMGLWRPLPRRDANEILSPLRQELPGLLGAGPDPIRAAAARLAETYQIREVSSLLLDLVRNGETAPAVRVAALRALGAMNEHLSEAVRAASSSSHEELRKTAIALQPKVQDADPAERLAATLATGSVGEKQSALTALASVTSPRADAILSDWMDKLIAGNVIPELKLELIETAAKRNQPDLRQKLDQFEKSRPAGDLGPYVEVLAGGNPDLGRRTFLERPEASCLRCHQVGGQGGESGPPMDGIGGRKTREYLLEAIVFPNKHTAEGYETVIVSTKGGGFFAGTVRSENDTELVLNAVEGEPIRISKGEIVNRTTGMSGMPEGLALLLSRRDLRDLVEFLATLK